MPVLAGRCAVSRLLAAMGLLATLCGCSAPNRPACGPAQGSPLEVFTLFFGTAIPGRGDLTGDEWHEFLAATVAANLPDGYTVFDARGGWMNPVSHKTIEEGTKVLLVALPDVPESLAAIDRIRTAYQTEFKQQLVGMTVQPACGSF